MLRILIANKDTLEELIFSQEPMFTEIAMLMLQEKHVRMEKVVNLSFFHPEFTQTSLLETKAVFPTCGSYNDDIPFYRSCKF
jgi:hypothetical protein